jgi:hypothetical protein
MRYMGAVENLRKAVAEGSSLATIQSLIRVAGVLGVIENGGVVLFDQIQAPAPPEAQPSQPLKVSKPPLSG